MSRNKCVIYDFGSVETGSSADKTIKICNNESKTQEYEVHRDPLTNPLDYVFEVEPYRTKIDPGCTFLFHVLYSPTIPFCVNYDYFNVSDSSGIIMKFGVKGSSIGPNVNVSKRLLEFCCTGSKSDLYQEIELRNTSKVCATFQFDIDEKQCVFKLNKTFGNISSNKRIRIGVTFVPPSPGTYIKRLYCLIKHQHPLVIDIVGLCKSWESMKFQGINFIKYPQQEIIKGAYASYISDSITITDHKPPLTLSTNCIDFGQIDITGDQIISNTVSVTNHMKEATNFEWDIDKTGVFSMYPRSAVIPNGHSALFQAYFRPNKQNCLYGVELEGRAYWDYHCKDVLVKTCSWYQVCIPVPFSIRMMGHTFLPHSIEGIPQCQVVPQNVVLPACIPSVPVYTTFTIERIGQLPLMFKFLPPQVTHYTMKPMQGVITRGSQIIIVQLYPEKLGEMAYVERWGLQFNGSPKSEICVDFRAYAEYPSLQFGRMNVIVFPATFPGCQQTVNVEIRNITRHGMRFNYHESEIPENMEIVEKNGILAPNEIIYNLWQYVPYKHGEFIMTVKCEVNILQECYYPVGMPADVILTAYGYSEYVDLVAFPEKISFGVSTLGITKKKIFHLFNFGNCQMHYKLKVIHYTYVNSSKQLNDVSLNPLFSTMGPNKRKEITVTLCPSELGLNEFIVMYDIRINSQSETIIHKITDKVLTVIQYDGIFPTLQVHDIGIYNGGPVFCKLWLWKMLSINRLNNALAKVMPNSMVEVSMTLPEGPQFMKPVTIFFLLKNNSELPNSWKLKRQKVCDCPLVSMSKGLSFRCRVYDCPHRAMFQIVPTSGELEPDGKVILRLIVRYKIEGCWHLKYVIYLSNNRAVMLTAILTVLSSEKPKPSIVEPSFKLWDIYIGDVAPSLQVFWVYNNTKLKASYEVSTVPIMEFNKAHFNMQVITCLNPQGYILPKSNYPILFRFNPLELKGYELNCLLRLQNKLHNIAISGNGTVTYDSHICAIRDKMPDKRRYVVPEDQILVSISHIVINPIPTFTKVHRIFFIENNSDYFAYAYQWHRYDIPNVLKAIVKPARNSLQPNEAYVCILEVTTYGLPCLVSFPIKCQLLNLTERSNHEKSILVRSSVEHLLEGQFNITEEDTTVPTVDVPIDPAPTPFFKVLTVSCSIASSKSLDVEMPFQTQMRHIPNREHWSCTAQTQSVLTPLQLQTVVSVLDKMIWNVVFSKWFDNMVTQLHKEDTPFYCQFAMKEHERSFLNELSFFQPPRKLMHYILHEIIFDLLYTEFSLGTIQKDKEKFDLRNCRRSQLLSSSSLIYPDNTSISLKESKLSEVKIKVPDGW